MKKPYVIAINSISGGGKTALTELLAASLTSAVQFHFDEFDDTNVYPSDYYEWTVRGSDLLEFDCPGMADALWKELNRESIAFVILDYPFGREHPRFQKEIDLSIYIDTPLDIAMARRILRDFTTLGASAEERLEALKKDLIHYLAKARHPYLDHDRHRETSDLVLDGRKGLNQLRDQVLRRIDSEQGACTQPSVAKAPSGE